jgi:hypothetical protein
MTRRSLSAGFVPLIAVGATLSATSLRSFETALDQSPPSPTTLLSAEEATERLRDIIEGFFFRRASRISGVR